jgi:AcrR family transcriptional regulator
VSATSEGTRRRLREAALVTVRQRGIAGVSARTVAAAAGVRPSVIYYHFDSLHALLAEASTQATAARVATYRARFAAVGTVPELVVLAREVHEEERRLGNVTVLAQMLAGARADPDLAPATTAAVQLWVDEVTVTLHRLLDGTVLAPVVDVPALARATSAAFVGLELLDGLERDDELPTLDALEQLAGLVQVVLDLGPLASSALRARMRRVGTR